MDRTYRTKFVLLGEQSVGKTAIIMRGVWDKFFSGYSATIGVSFCTRKVSTDRLELSRFSIVKQSLFLRADDR